jgi:hypothetical protein
VTVNVLPPIEMVPVREEVPGLAATLKPIVPGPDPLAPEVIVIQAVLLMATQVHPALVVMVAVPVPPDAETD